MRDYLITLKAKNSTNIDKQKNKGYSSAFPLFFYDEPMSAFLYLSIIFLWGFTWFAIKNQIGIVPIEISLIYRFAFAAVIIGVVMLIQRTSFRFTLKQHEEFKNEPKIALESGKDGLDILHKILSQARKYLNTNGALIAEVGFPAAKLLKKKYPRILFKWFKYRRPNGKESIFGMHGVFLCKRNDLPDSL